MNQYQTHIIDHLRSFVESKDEQFDLIFERMVSPDKGIFKGLLAYVHRLIDTAIPDGPDLNYLHLHFPQFQQRHNIILEFLCIKFFLLNIGPAADDMEGPDYIDELTARIESILSRDIQLGTGKRRVLEQETDHRRKLKRLRNSLRELQTLGMNTLSSKFSPACLINVLVKDRDDLIDTCAPTPYFMGLEDLSMTDLLRPMSFVLLNDNLNRDAIDELQAEGEQDILAAIRHVIIFNADGKLNNRQFNYADLNTLNTGEGLNVKSLIIVSFDQQPFRLSGLISQLSSITTRYFERLPDLDTRAYTIMPFEVDHLLDIQRPSDIQIEFIGKDNLIWQTFQERVLEYEDLQELISIKMRNIYSLCCNDICKGLILKDLFSTAEPRSLSTEAKERLWRLRDGERGELKGLLFSVLSMVQTHGPLNRVEEIIGSGKYCIILPATIFRFQHLMDEVRARLRHIPKAELISWKELRPDYPGNVIVLDYRDPGRYPYQIYPNIFEHTLEKGRSINAFFVTMFFKYNYEYAVYGYNRTLYKKILAHPARKDHFKWTDLVNSIARTKMDGSLSSLWDLDNSYTSNNERDPVVITLSTGSKKSYYPSEPFIAKYATEDRLFTIKAEDIIDDPRNKAILVQPLDELYEGGGNLFEATMEEEAEIEQLKKEFDLNDRDPETSLWKVLLQRRTEELGATEVYDDLKATITRSGLSFIREGYFIGHWLDPQSELLIPRSKRVFRSVCTYLALPEVYFRVMLKKRAKERLASKKSNAQMDRLIAALVDMGMFDTIPRDAMFDEAFMNKYDLEDIGFDIATLHDDLIALVDLCKAKFDLEQVITAEFKRS